MLDLSTWDPGLGRFRPRNSFSEMGALIAVVAFLIFKTEDNGRYPLSSASSVLGAST